MEKDVNQLVVVRGTAAGVTMNEGRHWKPIHIWTKDLVAISLTA